MSKNNSAKPPATLYEAVEVRRQHCSDEELDTHLRAFVSSFIIKESQERWLDFLVEKRSKWYPPALSKHNKYYSKAHGEFEMYFPLNGDCYNLIQGVEAYPMSLLEIYGATRGIYFDLREPACKLTPAEAASLVMGPDSNRGGTALLSLIPGKKVLYFNYEMDEGVQGVCVCRRT